MRRTGIMARRVDNDAQEFVWCEGSPAFGSEFTVDGVLYRRPVPQGFSGSTRKQVLNRGAEPDFSKGPIHMYSEPMKGHGPVDAPHYADGGRVAVFRNMGEIREYQAKNQAAGRNLRWDKG